jgi:hypothetical protein
MTNFLSPDQLKQAVHLKKQIAALEGEPASILAGDAPARKGVLRTTRYDLRILRTPLRAVWEKKKALQNDDFVEFVEKCRNWK